MPTIEDIEEALRANQEAAETEVPPAADQPEPEEKPAKKSRTRKPRVTNDEADVAPETEAYQLKGFTHRDVPWGQLGAKIEPGTVITASEAAHLGGLDFQVELLDCGFKTSQPVKVGKSPWLTVPRRRAAVRVDTQQFFSFVSDTYKPIQYAEAFAFMDEISPHYVAAGTLGGGRQGFMVVKLDSKIANGLKIKGKEDPHDMYVVLRTSHDLTRALEVSVLNLRGACMNALTLSSFGRQAPQRWSVKHAGKDPMSKLNEARRTLARADAYEKEFLEIAHSLADIDVTIEEAKKVLTTLLPDRPKRDDTVNAIVHAWQHSDTNGFTDNGWGLTNAVSEYFEWGRNEGTRTAASRFTGGLTGATHRYTNRTAQLLLRRR